MKKYFQFIKEDANTETAWFSQVNSYNKTGAFGYFDAIKKMILDTPEIINAINEYKDTALIISYKVDLVKYLISHGAKINMQGKNGDTALIRASRSMDGQKMRVLIEKNAIMEIPNDEGKTFFDYLPNNNFGNNFKKWVETFRPQYGNMKKFDL